MVTNQPQQVIYKDLGSIDYKIAWDLQSEIQQQLIHEKRTSPNCTKISPKHHLLFCEHEPVYTLGRNGIHDHLLLNNQGLLEKQIQYYKINRGGDITYHGPGQITVYPIFDLDGFFTDVHKYVRFLEETVIRTLAKFSITATRYPSYTGVWIEDPTNSQMRKICAIGVHLSRWVSMHGLALNVNTALDYFKYIIPCGIQMKNTSVTSMENELQRVVDMTEVKETLKQEFALVFGYTYRITKEN